MLGAAGNATSIASGTNAQSLHQDVKAGPSWALHPASECYDTCLKHSNEICGNFFHSSVVGGQVLLLSTISGFRSLWA